jgi:diacylglycerol kinase
MKLLQSFGYAFKGLFAALQSELNMKIHLLAVVIVVFAGFYFEITNTEWALVLLCMALVIALELINTAIEKLLNKLHPEFDETIGLCQGYICKCSVIRKYNCCDYRSDCFCSLFAKPIFLVLLISILNHVTTRITSA